MSHSAASERDRAAAVRMRAAALCTRAGELQQQADDLVRGLVANLGRTERLPGDRGDVFALRLPRLPAALRLGRHSFGRWLERRGVGRDDVADLTLAFSEACANAMEHPRAARRPAVEVSARVLDDDLEIVIRDFGSWGRAAPAESGTRGRGLEMIRSLMDDVAVAEARDGTRVTMRRRLRG
jgi:anti-sigma regulatory factor (Ser/Thr protein kinase)